MEFDDFLQYLGTAVVIILIILVVVALFAVPVLLLWNWLMPTIFGLPEITFWQAVGVTLLAQMLFGGHCSNHKKD